MLSFLFVFGFVFPAALQPNNSIISPTTCLGLQQRSLGVNWQAPSRRHCASPSWKPTTGFLSQFRTRVLKSPKKHSQSCEGWNRAVHAVSEKGLPMFLDDLSEVHHPGSFKESFIWLQKPSLLLARAAALESLSFVPLEATATSHSQQILLVSLCSCSHQLSLTLHIPDLAWTPMTVT